MFTDLTVMTTFPYFLGMGRFELRSGPVRMVCGVQEPGHQWSSGREGADPRWTTHHWSGSILPRG